MAQSLHFILTGEGKRVVVDQIPDRGKQAFLAGTGNLVLKLVTDIKMIFDGAFAAAGDKAEFMNAGICGFLHPVLHQWLVNDRQNFLGHGLGGRKETGAVSGNREEALFDHDCSSLIRWFTALFTHKACQV